MKPLTYKIHLPGAKTFSLTNYRGETVRVDTGDRIKETRLHFIKFIHELRKGKYSIDVEKLS